jgi:DNA-binding beta-propeller fold protein YncE
MKFELDGTLVWSKGGKGSGSDQLIHPAGLALDVEGGFLYVVDSGNHRIQKRDLDGKVLATWGEKGSGAGQFHFSDFSGVALDERGFVYVADSHNNRIQAFDAQGNHVGGFGESGFGGLQRYRGVSALSAHKGRLYVVDNAGFEVEVFKIKYPD